VRECVRPVVQLCLLHWITSHHITSHHVHYRLPYRSVHYILEKEIINSLQSCLKEILVCNLSTVVFSPNFTSCFNLYVITFVKVA